MDGALNRPLRMRCSHCGEFWWLLSGQLRLHLCPIAKRGFISSNIPGLDLR